MVCRRDISFVVDLTRRAGVLAYEGFSFNELYKLKLLYSQNPSPITPDLNERWCVVATAAVEASLCALHRTPVKEASLCTQRR